MRIFGIKQQIEITREERVVKIMRVFVNRKQLKFRRCQIISIEEINLNLPPWKNTQLYF